MRVLCTSHSFDKSFARMTMDVRMCRSYGAALKRSFANKHNDDSLHPSEKRGHLADRH